MAPFLVIKNGYLVTDAYFYPFTAETMHDMASVTKSVTSTILGVALTQNLIEGLDQAVLDAQGRLVFHVFFSKCPEACQLCTERFYCFLEIIITGNSGKSIGPLAV